MSQAVSQAGRQAGTQARTQAGFTLLELLVGLVVLGFILAGLGQSVRYGLRAGNSQARLSDGRSELDSVDRALRSLIEQADPGSVRTKASLQGSAGRLVLTSELPEAAATVRLVDLSLGIDPAHRLVLRWTPHRHALAFGEPPAVREDELLRGVSGLEIAYWQDGWRNSWDQASLPRLVRIHIAFPPGDPRHWPDIVVATRREKEAG